MLMNTRVEVTDFTNHGKCSGCGQCCSNMLPLSENEIKRIKKYVKEHDIKEQRHNFVASAIDFTCPFRDEANQKCLIYSIRPDICREFMCNHTIEDIKKAKLDFHRINRVVMMRHEFFGSMEELKIFDI